MTKKDDSDLEATDLPPGEDEDVTWHDSIHDIDGLQFIQVRLSFINNTESELNPELSALGIAFEKLN